MELILIISSVALWIVVLINSALLVGVIRLVSERRQQDNSGTQQLPTDAKVPEFSVMTESGETITNRSLAGKTSALPFVSPDCPTCMTSVAELQVLDSKVERQLVVVCRSSQGKCRTIADQPRGKFPVVFDTDERMSQQFGITSNPTAVMMSDAGTVLRYGHPLGKEELDVILASV